MNKFKKIKNSEMKDENFEMKQYVKEMNTFNARILFKFRSKMTQYVKMNFKNDKKYSSSLWKCDQCGKVDTQQHILWCEANKELRENKDITNDRDLVEYICKVQKIREKIENDRKKAELRFIP